MRWDPKALARATDPVERKLAGLVRRMAIAATAKALWQVAGYLLPDSKREVLFAELFAGIGLYGRPPADSKPEAVVVNVGGAAGAPAIVGIRDEQTRAAVAGAVKADETMLYNSKVVVYLKDNGTLEARTVGGVAVELALKSDVQDVVTKYNGHAHADPATGFTGTPVTAPAGTPRLASNPVGTSKFKAE